MTMPVMCSRLLRANLFAWIYMYLFHVCFTGLHLVSLWLQDVHLRFILDVYLKKTETTKNYKHYTAGFQLSNQCLGFYCRCLSCQFSWLIFNLHFPSHLSRPASGNAGSKSSAWHHRALRAFLSGFCSTSTSTSFHWHFVIFDWLIWCIYRGHCEFSLCSAFLRFWTSIFRRVDTPSVADALTPAASPAASSDHFPEDWTDAIRWLGFDNRRQPGHGQDLSYLCPVSGFFIGDIFEDTFKRPFASSFKVPTFATSGHSS